MSPALQPLKVLIVEDEALVAMFLEDVVLDLGHEVVATAGRLERALTLADTLACDLAIIDVNLNGETTYALADRLAARQIPFIFATGYGAEAIDKRWAAALVLQKPFQAHELAAAIARAFPLAQAG
jgi:CheY-like chemotaxis protein